MSGNLAHRQYPDPIRTPSFRAKQADAFSSLPLPRKVGLRREKSLFASAGFIADLLLRRFTLNLLLCPGLLVLTFALNAQAPTAVPIPKEPHHHLVLENDYVRVFRVSVPAHESTLLHQHDVPYLYVSLGPADVINAVQGKPEARLVMADGQVGYSPGHFAHIARNESGAPFNNVTIELLRPQGNARNICAGVVPDAPGPGICESPRPDARIANSIILFKTDALVTEHHSLGPKVRAPDSKSRKARLLIFDSDSPLRVELPNKTLLTPKAGDVLWVEAGSKLKITNPNQSTASRYLVLSFKHAGDAKKP